MDTMKEEKNSLSSRQISGLYSKKHLFNSLAPCTINIEFDLKSFCLAIESLNISDNNVLAIIDKQSNSLIFLGLSR